jgi:DDE superfamily endonuclease
VQAFIASMEQYHESHHFGADATYSADETLVCIKMTGQGCLRLEAVGKVNRNYVFPKGLHYGSIIPFSNAAGHTVLIVLVLPLQLSDVDDRSVEFYLPELQAGPKDHLNLLYAFTATGRMNTELFRAIMRHFVAAVQLRSPGVAQQLYLDRLGCHLDPLMVGQALQHGVHICWYPPDCSAFLQPCDDAEFAVFHRALNNVVQRFDLSRLAAKLPHYAIVLCFLQEALKLCTASNVVKTSFARTGIFPWKKELILSNARNYLAAEAAAAARPPVDPALAILQQAALGILSRENVVHDPKRVRARPLLNHVYTSEELLDMHEKMEQEKQKAKQLKAQKAQERIRLRQEKAAALKTAKEERHRKREEARAVRKVNEERKLQQRKAFSCKACGCVCRSREAAGVTAWIWCSYCDEFAICPYRRACPTGPEVLGRHEEEEAKRKKRRLLGVPVSFV